MSGRKLLSKTNAEGLEASCAGYLVAQVQQEMHIFDGDDQSRERSLCVVLSGGLNKGK